MVASEIGASAVSENQLLFTSNARLARTDEPGSKCQTERKLHVFLGLRITDERLCGARCITAPYAQAAQSFHYQETGGSSIRQLWEHPVR